MQAHMQLPLPVAVPISSATLLNLEKQLHKYLPSPSTCDLPVSLPIFRDITLSRTTVRLSDHPRDPRARPDSKQATSNTLSTCSQPSICDPPDSSSPPSRLFLAFWPSPPSSTSRTRTLPTAISRRPRTTSLPRAERSRMCTASSSMEPRAAHVLEGSATNSCIGASPSRRPMRLSRRFRPGVPSTRCGSRKTRSCPSTTKASSPGGMIDDDTGSERCG